MAGRGIKDYGGMPHSSDMMMKSKTHTKGYSSAEGAGSIKNYPDTTEAIKRDQSMGAAKMKSHNMKEGYRY